MTRSSTKKLLTLFEEPERLLHLTRWLFKKTSLVYSSSPGFDLFSDLENQSEEVVTEAMTEPTMEEYVMKTREDYGSSIARPNGSDNEDANEHIKKVLKIVDLFHIPEVTRDQIILRVFPMFLTGVASYWLRNEPAGLDVPTRQILDSKGVIPSMKDANAKKAIQDMADHSQKWHNGMSTRTRSTETSDGLVAIQAQLNNLGRKIKKVNEKFMLLKLVVNHMVDRAKLKIVH
ncbi:hypothetical protein Tco_0662295 [Tanacetum coccineum]